MRLMIGTGVLRHRRLFFGTVFWSFFDFKKWQRFAMISRVPISRIASTTLLFKLYGESAIYPNNNPASFTQPLLWFTAGDHFFQLCLNAQQQLWMNQVSLTTQSFTV